MKVICDKCSDDDDDDDDEMKIEKAAMKRFLLSSQPIGFLLAYAMLPAMPMKMAWAASCRDQSPTFLMRRRRAWSSWTSRAKASYVCFEMEVVSSSTLVGRVVPQEGWGRKSNQ